MSNPCFQVASTPTLTVTVKLSSGAAYPVAGATVKKLRVSPPSGASFEVDMSYTTDGSDGKLYATLTASQLALPGEYRFQVFLTLANGWSGPTRPASFTVVANLPSP